jgi:hypothetical protein
MSDQELRAALLTPVERVDRWLPGGRLTAIAFLCGAFLSLVMAVLTVVSFIEDRADRAALHAKLETLDQKIAERDKVAEDAKQRVDRRTNAARSPEARARLVSEYAQLTQPLILRTPVPTEETPNPAAAAFLDEKQLEELVTYAGICEKCKIEREQLAGDLKDTQTQLEACKATVKGGTRWQRFKRGFKSYGAGVVTGLALRGLLGR